MNQKVAKVLHAANISRHISRHLVGRHHTTRHHKITGAGIMAGGVAIALWASHIEIFIIHFIGDIIGYALHGIGLIPYIGDLEKHVESANITTPTNEPVKTNENEL